MKFEQFFLKVIFTIQYLPLIIYHIDHSKIIMQYTSSITQFYLTLKVNKWFLRSEWTIEEWF